MTLECADHVSWLNLVEISRLSSVTEGHRLGLAESSARLEDGIVAQQGVAEAETTDNLGFFIG